MSRIRGRNTKPELVLRKRLFAEGLRYRLHDRRLPGSPDLVFSQFRAVVFVHGCFWHRHENCRLCTVPSSNVELWSEKFQKNVARDERNVVAVQSRGWRVLIVWECELGTEKLDATVQKVESWLHQSRS